MKTKTIQCPCCLHETLELADLKVGDRVKNKASNQMATVISEKCDCGEETCINVLIRVDDSEELGPAFDVAVVPYACQIELLEETPPKTRLLN